MKPVGQTAAGRGIAQLTGQATISETLLSHPSPQRGLREAGVTVVFSPTDPLRRHLLVRCWPGQHLLNDGDKVVSAERLGEVGVASRPASMSDKKAQPDNMTIAMLAAPGSARNVRQICRPSIAPASEVVGWALTQCR